MWRGGVCPPGGSRDGQTLQVTAHKAHAAMAHMGSAAPGLPDNGVLPCCSETRALRLCKQPCGLHQQVCAGSTAGEAICKSDTQIPSYVR